MLARHGRNGKTLRMSTLKLVAFAGSLRTASYNKLLAAQGAELARAAGAEVTLVDLRELALPLFDEDLEKVGGLPVGAKRLKSLMRESDGYLIASPEYNSSITPVLKNAIDWVSRPEQEGEPSLVAFDGKVAALCAASPGPFGGMRGLVHLRSVLGNIGVLVLPGQVTISAAYEAFDAAGKLKDERKTQQLAKLAQALVSTAGKLKSAS